MLEELRAKIDATDAALLKTLSERRALVKRVIEAKVRDGLSVRHPEREAALLSRLVERGRALELDAPFVMRVFRAVIADSVRLQRAELERLSNDEHGEATWLRIAHLGTQGSFSHFAARTYADSRSRQMMSVSCASFEEVLSAVEKGDADVGALPVENSTSGSINEAYDALINTRLSVVGERRVPVVHCLVARPGVTVDAIERLFAHPQPLAQCSRFVGGQTWSVEVAPDTTSAAHNALHAEVPAAAIASLETADRLKLDVLRDDIANDAANATRFLFVARKPRVADARIPCKTSLVMSTGQKPGALVDALLAFRDAGVGLVKLESRPVPGNAWEELFYIDVAGHSDDERLRSAIEAARSRARSLRVLGCYPSDDEVVAGVA